VVPRLVRAEQLPHANGILLSAQTASENVIGPAVGGSLFVILAALPFFVDGLSFVLSGTLALFALVSATRTSREPTIKPRFRDDLRDGLSAFRESSDLPVLLVVVSGFAVAQAMVIGPLVLFATRTLHMTAKGFGLMIGISSLGNVVGSLAAGRVVARADPAKILRIAGVVIAVSYLVAGLAPNAFIATAALSVEAIAVAIGVVAHVSLRQRLFDPAMLGRVGNIFRTATMGLMPIGALFAGVLAQTLGLRAPLIAACLLQALVVVFAVRRLRPVAKDRISKSLSTETTGELVPRRSRR
jgi:MFS family permease